MILVRQLEPGLITVDFSQEHDFDLTADGVDLLTGLFVQDIRPQEIIVEDAGQLGHVLSYILKRLTDRGYTVTLDSSLQKAFDRFREEQALANAIRRGKAKKPTLGPVSRFGILRTLLPHQLEGVRRGLMVHHAANFSVPGSGKTAIAISIFAILRHEGVVDRALIIGPASSFAPWEDEYRLTLGRKANVLRLIGTRPERMELLRHLEDVDLILCTYHMAYREREGLARILSPGRYLLVLDESHHIKNFELGPWARTALELAPLAERRMILTGTPVPHSPRDLWSQFTFLWPSLSVLGTSAAFEQRVQSSPTPLTDLRRGLGPFFMRTKKSDLHLPRPISDFTKISYSRIPKRQRLIIRLLEMKTLQEARELGLAKADLTLLRKWRKARTIRLLQAASNPALLSTASAELGNPGEPFGAEPTLRTLLEDYLHHETPAKVEFVVNMVRALVREGKKVVVWAYFVGNLRLLNGLLTDLDPLMVYGEVPPYEEDTDPEFESRERNIREFITDKNRLVLLANPAACAESISLHTVCHHAVYLERTFNCGHFLQSMDRIHRVGMPKDVRPHYHIPVLACAVEQVLDHRLKQRQRVLYNFLNDDMPILGYEDETSLLEREDDLEVIFQELLQEIAVATKRARTAVGTNRSPR